MVSDSTIDIDTPEGRRVAIELSREAQLPFAIYLDGKMRKIDLNLPIKRNIRHPLAEPVPIEVGLDTPTDIKEKHSVEVKRILTNSRVNLTVPSKDYNAALEAGAMLDDTNGIMYISPRMDLLPVLKWLPFDLDHYQYCKVNDEYSVLAPDPSMPGAAGPTNMDGSPDMTHITNVKVAEMLGIKSLSAHSSTGGIRAKL